MNPAPFLLGTCLLMSIAAPGSDCQADSSQVRDVTFFLRRLRTLDHLPELEASHTAMSSTWDRSGGNNDGTDFKRIEGTRNILLDTEGPGCIHRLFVGTLDPRNIPCPAEWNVDGTRMQVFLDGNATPIFDRPVTEFFDPERGPIPYPLAGSPAQGWTYPGCLFPIPFAKHCRLELFNPKARNWGCFWQVTYTTYSAGTRVQSLSWPLQQPEKAEMEAVGRAWLQAQATPPPSPARWSVQKTAAVEPDGSATVRLKGRGIIREMRVSVKPATPEILRNLRLEIRWDAAQKPSVDVPVGYFFGHADCGHAKPTCYNSLLLGVTETEAYSRFPMPFDRGAVIEFHNRSGVKIEEIRVAFDVEKQKSLPRNTGRFHATWDEQRAATPEAPVFDKTRVPVHMVLDSSGRGKYVGLLLHVAWPHTEWWGEGDWLIWTDETDWPPSYHGTGSEEYFNSGWCRFDRKAMSGYIKVHPGDVSLYSLHLNDAFQFLRRIRVAVETMGFEKGDTIIRQENPIWGSTAFWYALPAQPAGSRPSPITPR